MDAIQTDPGIMHGTTCFAGTRVPVTSLFEHLAQGYSLDYFIYQFPTVEREQAEAVIEYAKELVLARHPASPPEAVAAAVAARS